ncbi:hypothetical protein L0664_13845 [Octadecabacter sp. G9-8]|uniref:Uncharacterized protein n=1 Tax=Octadecabacter dasysiphoniae TaxID=2909341 RepID=A0ABS9CZB8_9RHOB|nr:hypothetical protein [Octadecabacter dasysiphoniae]MCF2872154.1 hypothetical protein [Octadecabacter dasysiphoniae]
MPITNELTAQAATQSVVAPIRPIRLLGVFQNPTNTYVLLQTRSGEMVRLSALIPTAGLRLISVSDGSAMVEEGDTLHRLIIG